MHFQLFCIDKGKDSTSDLDREIDFQKKMMDVSSGSSRMPQCSVSGRRVEGIYEHFHTHAHAHPQTVVTTAAPDIVSLPSLISKVHPLFSITWNKSPSLAQWWKAYINTKTSTIPLSVLWQACSYGFVGILTRIFCADLWGHLGESGGDKFTCLENLSG